MDQREIDQICIQIAWLERFLYELDCISQQPLPEMNGHLNTMGQSAPQFFGMLRYLLVDTIYITIARLLDPPTQGRNTNLTIETIINNNLTDPQKSLALSNLDEVRSIFKNGREIRNKIIAHPDYQAVYNYPTTLTPIPIEDLQNIGVKIRLLVDNYFSSTQLPHVLPQNDTSWDGVKKVLELLRS